MLPATTRRACARAACSAPYRPRTAATHTVRVRNQHATRRGRVECLASTGKPVYRGMYGPWSVEAEDEREVLLYRSGLTGTAAALVLGSIAVWSGNDALELLLQPLCALGALSFGLSLLLIHIYVDELKRTLQVFWLLGVCGGIYLAATQSEPVPLVVASQPWSVWAVGPTFAALTGVAFKEGVCYGKGEAFALCLLLPVVLLVHLSGAAPPLLQGGAWAVVCGLLSVFAARKWTQAVKDDIGDKSVFEFRKLPPEQQEQLLRKLELQE